MTVWTPGIAERLGHPSDGVGGEFECGAPPNGHLAPALPLSQPGNADNPLDGVISVGPLPQYAAGGSVSLV